MPTISAVLMATAMFAASATAHMILNTPFPYGNPNNSPLDASGSDFPCKALSNAGARVTTMQIGSQQPLNFNGSAVHGGGSCQISLTKDSPATKSSKWIVIHSIEGGCPAKGVSANKPDPGGPATQQVNSDQYTFTIPNGVAPGDYTLAWTWFNKIGNREMYMNCAMVKITGGSSKRDTHEPHLCNNSTHDHEHGEHRYHNQSLSDVSLYMRDTPSFPEMFVANIPTSVCQTADSEDLQFPNPGSSVDKFGTTDPKAPAGSNCNAGPAGAGGGSGTSAASTSGSGSGSGSGSTGASGQSSTGSGGSGSGSGSSSGQQSPGSGSTGAGTGSSSGQQSPGSGSAAGSAGGSGSQSSGGQTAASSGTTSSSSSSSGSGTSNSTSSSSSHGSGGGTGASQAVASPASVASTSSSAGTGAGTGSGTGTGAGSGTGTSTGTGSGAGTGSGTGSGTGTGAGTTSGSGAGKGSCTSAGQSVCSPDGRQIGTCANDLTVTWIPVASGTKCSGGLMVMANARKVRRHSRFVKRAIM